MTELKPCPFCGSNAYPLVNMKNDDYSSITIHCEGCGIIKHHSIGFGYKSLISQDAEDVKSAWNTRPIENELRVEIDRLDKSETQLIDERDDAEEAMSQAYYLVTGNSPEWSNLFGYEQANGDIKDAVNLLKAEIDRLTKERDEARFQAKRYVVKFFNCMKLHGDINPDEPDDVLPWENKTNDPKN